MTNAVMLPCKKPKVCFQHKLEIFTNGQLQLLHKHAVKWFHVDMKTQVVDLTRDKIIENFQAAVTYIANKDFPNWTNSTIETSTSTASNIAAVGQHWYTRIVFDSNQNHIVWFENHFNIQKVSSSLYQQSRCFRVSILDGSSSLENNTDDNELSFHDTSKISPIALLWTFRIHTNCLS